MRDADKTAYWIVESGSFAYNPARINVGSIGYQSTRKNVIVSSLYEVFKTDHSCDDRFLWHWFKSSLFTKQIEMLQEGGVRLYFFFDKLQKSEIWMPNVDEQRKIGQQFDQLDSLITLHQRKRRNGPSTHPLVWEQRKLGELFEEYSEKNRADLPPLTIIQGGGTVYRDESNRNLQFDKNSLSNYKAVSPGDFIVHLRSFEGGLEKATCCGLISPAYHTFHGNGIDSDFYYLYFRSKRFIDTDLKPHVYGIRDGRSIDIDGMKTISIPWATVNEQRAIGGFFKGLDNLITLHQRKYDKLVQLKKSMLDKMFPKPGETEPEIRFAGFTDPWEQRKLGEFSKKKTTKNADGALSETFTNSAEQGVISQLDYFDHDITNDANISGYYVVQPDDFVYNPRISVTAPCGPINRNRLNRAGVMSPLYTVFSVDTSVDKTYLEHYFKTSRWHDFMFLEGNTGARSDRFSISDATFFEMPIWRPGVSEQMAIAKQLETTDSLITLHQRKLELLRNTKKSLLDRMFV